MASAGSSLARLRELLAGEGILHSTAAQPILHRDGSVAPWMFYSWNVTLTPGGLGLAADCLLERLSTFQSTQLAAHGMTALPLLSACVGMGGGRYTGVAIRKARKPYLSRRLVEGPLDRSRSVVVIDDSLSSGTALRSAIAALEAEGCVVEGAVVLVNFSNRGGLEWATANGYRVEVLFDVAGDLGQALFPLPPEAPPLPAAPEASLPAGLPPAVLARYVAEHVLAHGSRPTPPQTLDRPYDGRGGVFVSFRRRSDSHRLARGGLWHFDGEPAHPPSDVVDATIATLREAQGKVRAANLAELKLGVTFLGPMEAVLPRQLDFDRWAIVVRDATGRRAGGALPNTQVFTSEVQQYTHAWQRNARIGPTEPHRLYRQAVDKNTEPGVPWPAYGAPDPPTLAWARDPQVGAALTRWARGVLLCPRVATRPPDTLITSPIEGVSVALYRHGTVAAAIAWGPAPVTSLIEEAVAKLIQRIDPAERVDPAACVMVGVLHEPEQLTGGAPALAAQKVRKGLDTVRIDSGARRVALLPGALVYNGWSKGELIASLVAAVPPGPIRFTTYRTALWLDDGDHCRPVRSGFALRDGGTGGDPLVDIRTLAGFLVRNLGPEGIPLYLLDIATGRRTVRGTGPRQLHALMGLDRAGRLLDEPAWRDAARRGFEHYLADPRAAPGGFAASAGGPLADAIVLAALGSPEHPLSGHPGLTAPRQRLRSWLDPHGRIAAQRVRIGHGQDLEYLPGAALVALAADEDLLGSVEPARLLRCLPWHRNRFRVLRSWGQLGWQLQGWAAVWGHQRSDEQAAFVFELADWALERQLDKNGAFLEDLSPTEPSFNTGFIAEGIAAAWSVALGAGDSERAARYEASWRRANGFMRTLLVAPQDGFICADPAAALGGVRLTASVVHVRADSVSHWLNALITGAHLATPGTGQDEPAAGRTS